MDLLIKFTHSFQVGVDRHDWACPKLDQMVSRLYLKNELNYEVGFKLVVRDPWKLQAYSGNSSCHDQALPK